MKNQLKNSIKSGLIFGGIMGIFFTLMSLLGILASGFDITTFIVAIVMGVLCGITCAILFGLLIFIFLMIQAKSFSKVRKELSQHHEIIYDDGANHFAGKEAVGGWLFLLSNSLYFKSHGINIQNHILAIPLNTIKSVTRCRISKIANNGLLIETVDGNSEKYVVNNPNLWIEQITETMKQINERE